LLLIFVSHVVDVEGVTLGIDCLFCRIFAGTTADQLEKGWAWTVEV
jgi:hypothetical protein